MRPATLVMAGVIIATVAACAAQPMTRERAARLCADEAREADGISGSVRAGLSNGEPAGGGTLRISSAIFNPQAEADALEACIARRMGGGGNARPGSGLTLAIEGSL